MNKFYNNSLEFVQAISSKSARKAKLYKAIFWLLTLFTLLFGFFSALMGVAKLASSRFPEEYKAFVTLFVTKIVENGKEITIDKWPIFTLWIGIIVAIINGLVALFLVKGKWLRNQKVNNLIDLELKLFNAELGKYSNSTTKEKVLFERVSSILGNNSRLISNQLKGVK